MSKVTLARVGLSADHGSKSTVGGLPLRDLAAQGVAEAAALTADWSGITSIPSELATVTAATLTPASSSAAGVQGTIAYDGTYVYICVNTNTWVRVLRNAW